MLLMLMILGGRGRPEEGGRVKGKGRGQVVGDLLCLARRLCMTFTLLGILFGRGGVPMLLGGGIGRALWVTEVDIITTGGAR